MLSESLYDSRLFSIPYIIMLTGSEHVCLFCIMYVLLISGAKLVYRSGTFCALVYIYIYIYIYVINYPAPSWPCSNWYIRDISCTLDHTQWRDSQASTV